MMTYGQQLNVLIKNALNEDIGDGDHSTLSTIDKNAKGKAVLKIKEEGVLAGVGIAQKVFHYLEPGAVFSIYKNDGEVMIKGETAFEVEARVHTILQCERLALNCMQRMSGIATVTRKFTDKLKGFHTKVLDTRKTTPNFRLLEKEAVHIGGGINHRMGLFDMIMLKDNHIDYCGGLEKAINKAYEYVQTKKPALKIEVETRSIDDVKHVVEVGKGKVFRIMLDNFSPDLIKEALIIIDSKIETEASGGINLANVISYAETGVDYVSIGGLIHQAKSVDMSLKAVVS